MCDGERCWCDKHFESWILSDGTNMPWCGGERDDGTEGITPCCRGKLVYDAVSPGAGGVHVDAWRVPGWMMEEEGYEYKE